MPESAEWGVLPAAGDIALCVARQDITAILGESGGIMSRRHLAGDQHRNCENSLQAANRKPLNSADRAPVGSGTLRWPSPAILVRGSLWGSWGLGRP